MLDGTFDVQVLGLNWNFTLIVPKFESGLILPINWLKFYLEIR